jgi:D-alanyl-lipoteichoic acid acyltransferase DltB (MBOAT superfamily)
MLFNSITFLFGFLPATLLIYHILRIFGLRTTAKVFLALASIAFYGWWNVKYVPLMVGSIVGNFSLSLLMERSGGRARLVTGIGIALNLALLGYFKYANFFVSAAADMTGLSLSMHKVVLPLAISFFTFQQVAYLVEAYRDRKAADSFLDYCLFVLFFPHLIAGPITHHKEMLPQFKRAGEPLAPSYITVGLTILVLGLAKKVLIADTLADICNPIFHAADAGRAPSSANAWLGALAYTLQLYFDFAGYSDMAIGLGLLFGIRLPVNFASPYKSTSIIEFWRRWHISLSRFLRNYLYIPLGGSRNGKIRRHLNLLATMALGGLWHGAGWTFLLWGVLHGLYLICNHVWRSIAPPSRGPIGSALAWLATMLAVVVAWVLFRAGTFGGALAMLGSMVMPAAGYPHDLPPPTVLSWLAVVAAGIAATRAPNVLEMTRYPDSTPGLPVEADGLRAVSWRAAPAPMAIGLGVLAAFAIAKLPDPGVFLYFNF